MNRCARFATFLVLLALITPARAEDNAQKEKSPDSKGTATAEKKPAKKEAAKKEAAAKKEKKSKELRYIRVERNEKKQPLALQTSIIRYQRTKNGKKQIVDLIGAVHVGSGSYYRDLNRRFKEYDAVLYELVAPKEHNVPRPGQRSGSFVSGVQVGMKSMLELDFQLDEINYRAKNMVHADMTPSEMAASMKERGESFLQMLFRMMGQDAAMSAKNPGAGTDMLFAFFARDRALRLRRAMANQFEALDGQLDALAGKNGSTLITERNKTALAVLTKELDKGHNEVAIFYGAGHLRDFEERLKDEFEMEPVSLTWVDAWDLKEKAKTRKNRARPTKE